MQMEYSMICEDQTPILPLRIFQRKAQQPPFNQQAQPTLPYLICMEPKRKGRREDDACNLVPKAAMPELG